MAFSHNALASSSSCPAVLPPRPVHPALATRQSPGSGQILSGMTDTVARPGLPSPADVELLLNGYIDRLSANKRVKALITRQMYLDIEHALVNGRSSVCTAQYRHWARNTFQLSATYVVQKGVRVAVREDFHEILCHAHVGAAHGGRDRTYAQVINPRQPRCASLTFFSSGRRAVGARPQGGCSSFCRSVPDLPRTKACSLPAPQASKGNVSGLVERSINSFLT